MRTLIQNGTVVTASDTMRADVLIEDEIITGIGTQLPAQPGDRLINASGKLVLPGGIDVHTHLDMPFMGTNSSDDFATGSKAAIMGGTTTFIDFINPEKGKPLETAYTTWQTKAQTSVADFGFHMSITEWTPEWAAELPRLVKLGVTSFKCFLAYKNALQIDDGTLINVLNTAGKIGAMVSIHAENGDMIVDLTQKFLAAGHTAPEYHMHSHPVLAESEAVYRGISLARLTGQPLYIVHLSSADGLAHIRKAQQDGAVIWAETCPQYLLLDSTLYSKPDFEGAKYVMSPPLRPKSHQDALWQGLNNGSIQVVGTDHCPFNFKGQKEMGRLSFAKIPNGAPGIGDRMNLLYTYGVKTGKLSLNRFVEVTATNPAKLFGMYPQKGSIAIGSDADILVYDPDKPGTISAKHQYHRCDFNSYEGFAISGAPDTVLLRGKTAVQNGQYVGEQGQGRYLARQPKPVSGALQ